MSLTIADKNHLPNLFSSIGFYGQIPRRCDFSKPLKPSQNETTVEQCKRYVWTFLPILTLSQPIGSAMNFLAETARVVKSTELLLKSQNLTTTSYQAFRILISAGAIGNILLDHSSSTLFRRICLGIRLLTIGHEIALTAHRIYRLQEDPIRYKSFKLCIHIINNILSLIAIVFQNPSSTYIFLLAQGITGVFQAIRKLDKDKYSAAGVHFFLAFFRFFQSYSILQRQVVVPPKPRPELVLPNFEELAKARLLMQIAPSENIKETLTKHENTIKLLLGEDYLYFKRKGPEEKFLILTAETDYNNGFNPLYIESIIRTLSQKFDVKFRTISTVEDIEKEVRIASQIGRVMGLMLRAHGSPTDMLLSHNSDSGLLNSKTISPELFAGLDPNCIIVLSSCSTAKYPFFSLAYRVANLSQRITFAPDNISYGAHLKQLDPMEWSFEIPGKNVRTKKLTPLKDSIFITFIKYLFDSK